MTKTRRISRTMTMTTPSTIESQAIMPATGLTRESVVALSEQFGEPEWLRESRRQAWDAYETLPTPRWTKGIAQWWTTDVSELDLSKLRAYVPADKSREEARSMASVTDDAKDEGSLLVQINSETAYIEVPGDVLAQGVIFCSLEEAVRTHPDLVQKYLHKLVTPNKDKFSALHSALWS